MDCMWRNGSWFQTQGLYDFRTNFYLVLFPCVYTQTFIHTYTKIPSYFPHWFPKDDVTWYFCFSCHWCSKGGKKEWMKQNGNIQDTELNKQDTGLKILWGRFQTSLIHFNAPMIFYHCSSHFKHLTCVVCSDQGRSL